MSNYDASSARVYDQVLFIFIWPLRRKIARIIKKGGFKKILDVCCGTGNQLKYLRRKGIEAEGVDLSPHMLQIAHSADIKCREEDAENMNYTSDEFDLVMTSFALHEKSNASAGAILKEMIRVCKPGGHILIADYALTVPWNISVKAVDLIERLAGEEHNAYYMEYKKLGGLDHLLKDMPLKTVSGRKALMGNVEIRLLEKTGSL